MKDGVSIKLRFVSFADFVTATLCSFIDAGRIVGSRRICNGRMSVRLSVCPVDRQRRLQLVWRSSGAGGRYRSWSYRPLVDICRPCQSAAACGQRLTVIRGTNVDADLFCIVFTTITLYQSSSSHSLHNRLGSYHSHHPPVDSAVLFRAEFHLLSTYCRPKKVAHTRLPSVGFRSWSRFLAVRLQVTSVIHLAVGCHYFPPGPQLPPQPLRSTATQFRCLVNRGTMGVSSFSDSVATAIWTQAFCAWVQHASHLAAEPPCRSADE